MEHSSEPARPDLAQVLLAPPALRRAVQEGGGSVEVPEASLGMLSAPSSTVPPMPAAPATSAAALAAAVLASRKADPAIGGRMDRPRRPHRPVSSAAPPPCPSIAPAAMAAPEVIVNQLPVPEVPINQQSVPKTPPSVVLASSPAGAGGCGGKTGRRSYAEVVASTSASLLAVGREADAAMGWQDIPSRCHPHRRSLSTPTLMRRPLPEWLSGRCCRCLFPGHRAAACRDAIRCSRCLQTGHRARECFNAWQPLSSLPGLVVSSRSQLAAHPCCGKKLAVQPSPLQCPATPPPPTAADELARQAMLLRSELEGCLARVESFLLSAGAALAPEVSPLAELNVCSGDVGEEGFYGDFSPRAMPSPQPHMLR